MSTVAINANLPTSMQGTTELGLKGLASGPSQQVAQVSTDAQKVSKDSLKALQSKESLRIWSPYDDSPVKPIYVLDRTQKSGVAYGPGRFDVFSTGDKPFDPSVGINIEYKIRVDTAGNVTITKPSSEAGKQDKTVQVKGSLDFGLDKDGKIQVNVKGVNGKIAPIERFFSRPDEPRIEPSTTPALKPVSLSFGNQSTIPQGNPKSIDFATLWANAAKGSLTASDQLSASAGILKSALANNPKLEIDAREAKSGDLTPFKAMLLRLTQENPKAQIKLIETGVTARRDAQGNHLAVFVEPFDQVTTFRQGQSTQKNVSPLPTMQGMVKSLEKGPALTGTLSPRLKELTPPIEKAVFPVLDAKPPVVQENNIQDGRRLDDISSNPANLEKLKGWIQSNGVAPENGMTVLMKENAVVIIGEQHDYNPHRKSGAKYMEALHQGGMTHLALEMPPSEQAGLDKFMKTGNPATLPNFAKGDDTGYLNMLKKARELGIKLVAVDSQDNKHRDETMAAGIANVLQNNPKAKVAFWVGDLHSSKAIRSDGTSDQLSVPDWLKLDQTIKAKGVATITAIFNPESAPWLNQIKNQSVVMVPSKGSPYADLLLEGQNAADDFSFSRGKSADYQIIYPPK